MLEEVFFAASQATLGRLASVQRLATPLPLAFLDAAVWAIRMPPGLDEEARARLNRSRVERYYEGTWIGRPRKGLDGRTPVEAGKLAAGGDAIARAKLEAVVRLREQLGMRPPTAALYQGYPFDRLRRRLGLPPTDPDGRRSPRRRLDERRGTRRARPRVPRRLHPRRSLRVGRRSRRRPADRPVRRDPRGPRPLGSGHARPPGPLRHAGPPRTRRRLDRRGDGQARPRPGRRPGFDRRRRSDDLRDLAGRGFVRVGRPEEAVRIYQGLAQVPPDPHWPSTPPRPCSTPASKARLESWPSSPSTSARRKATSG